MRQADGFVAESEALHAVLAPLEDGPTSATAWSGRIPATAASSRLWPGADGVARPAI